MIANKVKRYGLMLGILIILISCVILLVKECINKPKNMESSNWLKIVGDVEATKSRQEVYDIVNVFTKAYFCGDAETIKSYLAEPYERKIETYLDQSPYTIEDATFFGIKGLSLVSSKKNTIFTVEVEFNEAEEIDTLAYFFMEFEKQKDDWKINAYGLER
ncbi:MAG: hypothetical protein PHX08_24755 [Lachnospiraceae bacterium]|nr:hypothetical protein [Lachnospiraceae bacterium]